MAIKNLIALCLVLVAVQVKAEAEADADADAFYGYYNRGYYGHHRPYYGHYGGHYGGHHGPYGPPHHHHGFYKRPIQPYWKRPTYKYHTPKPVVKVPDYPATIIEQPEIPVPVVEAEPVVVPYEEPAVVPYEEPAVQEPVIYEEPAVQEPVIYEEPFPKGFNVVPAVPEEHAAVYAEMLKAYMASQEPAVAEPLPLVYNDIDVIQADDIQVPVAAPAAPAAPAAVPAPPSNVVSSQYHAQDEFGNYVYGYNNPNSAKAEQRDHFGNVIGSYSYVDGTGLPKHVSYVADDFGFRLTAANNLPIA